MGAGAEAVTGRTHSPGPGRLRVAVAWARTGGASGAGGGRQTLWPPEQQGVMLSLIRTMKAKVLTAAVRSHPVRPPGGPARSPDPEAAAM